jgi:hypothetical protein
VDLTYLEGQPAWVVIVVVFLLTLGALGAAYLRRRSAPDPEEPQIEGPPDKVSLPAGHDSFNPVREAMDMVAVQAARNAEEADRAEEEVRRLSKQLAECERDRAVLEERYQGIRAQLEACRRERHYSQEGEL